VCATPARSTSSSRSGSAAPPRFSSSRSDRKPRFPDPGRRRRRPQHPDRRREHDRVLRCPRPDRRQRARLAGGPRIVLQRSGLPGVVPGNCAQAARQHRDVPARRGVHPRVRPGDRDPPQPPGASLLPGAPVVRRVHRILPRRADDPRHVPLRVRRACARSLGCAELAVFLGRNLARARLLGLCQRGLPGRNRVHHPARRRQPDRWV
jgi:hypothetical protein